MAGGILTIMERIRLTRDEKAVLRLLMRREIGGEGCNSGEYISAVDSLQTKGLVHASWGEGHELVDARISQKGKIYLTDNPRLRNPVDWKWIVTTAIALAGAVLGAIACCKLI